MPAAIPTPVPATFAAIRIASPTGSGPRDGRGAVEPADLAEAAPAFPAEAAPAFFADAVFRAAPPAADRPPAADLPPCVAALAGCFFAPERFSLRRPGRERGRLPITPGSSVTRQKYYRGVAIVCARRPEIG
jgi:hypothetical protein